MKRIESLRDKALKSWYDNSEFNYKFYKHYTDSSNIQQNDEQRFSLAFAHALSTLTPTILDGELIVGQIRGHLSESEIEEWKSVYKPKAEEFFKKTIGGQDSHMAIDYELLLSRGIRGIILDIDERMAVCETDKLPFYNACKTCLNAVIAHSERYGAYAAELAEACSDSERKSELYEIARVCRTVPANPAKSFYEAVQAVNFISYCLSYNPIRYYHQQQFQLGRPDRYLLPFYLKDVKCGNITKERAQLLLDCLGIQINMRVPRGLSCGYMVGGRDEDGAVVANELTEMCMQVIEDIRLVYPSVGLCYTEDMPDKYLTLACEILSNGRSHPAIFGDDTIAKGLRCYGLTQKESRNYIHSTCVEITPIGASNVWVASPYTNMAQLLLDTMDREYSSFEEHLEAIFERLDRTIESNFNWHEMVRRERAKHSMNPLLSCFVNDCLDRGVDIERGGAKYNWVMPSFVGMANLTDSLYVIKNVVYDEKEMSLLDMKRILDENFYGNEALRQRFLNGYAKYGNDIDDVDAIFEKIVTHITSECKKYNGSFVNANLIPSVFCWIKHELFGRETSATPDGRAAGFPLGDGSGPCQGREMNGPTASILSSTKWAHHELIGGVAVNMKFAKSSLGKGSIEVMKSLVKTYIQRGGFEMQINVTDKEILERALENPEEYRDLLVRIGGYSDYFVRLSPNMQREVLERTEHTL